MILLITRVSSVALLYDTESCSCNMTVSVIESEHSISLIRWYELNTGNCFALTTSSAFLVSSKQEIGAVF